MRTMRALVACTVLLGWISALGVAAGPLDEAQRLLGASRYEEALRMLEPLAASNPYEGMTAYSFGVALARSGRCPEAMKQFEAALSLGANGDRNGMRSANLRMAECLAQMGDAAGSAARVREAWARWSADDVARLTAGEVYAPVRAGGMLTALTGRTATADAGGPAAQRRADLAYFDRLIRETHPAPFHATSEATWRQAVATLDASLPKLDAVEFNLGLMRLAAMVGDGHTSVFPMTEGENAFRILPWYPLRLADGWVIAAGPERELVGARIEGVQGRPFEEVFTRIRGLVPGDNDITALWLGGVALQVYEAYVHLGLAQEGTVAVDLRLASGERRTARLEPAAIDRDPNARWAPGAWPRIGADTLWLSDPSLPFSTRWLADERVLYVQLNQVADAEGQSMAQFGESVLAELRQRQAHGLVLDLRHNNGGSTKFAYPFLRSLARYEPLDRDGALVALIGPRSYSATMDLAGRLQRDMGALFVGWPTGGRPNGYATERPFALPYSGITGTISARWHQDGRSGDDHRPWLAPDMAVWPTQADILAGRDPVLKTALGIIGEPPVGDQTRD